jgi:hypothetical protein
VWGFEDIIPPPGPPGIVLTGLGLAGFVAWRVVRHRRGSRVGLRNLALWLAFYGFLFFLVLREGLLLYPVRSTFLNLVLLATGAILTADHTFKTGRLFRDAKGRLRYRTSPVSTVVWTALFGTRLYLEVAAWGQIYLLQELPSRAPSLPAAYFVAFLVIDGLFALSTGVLAGSNFGAYLHFVGERRREARRTLVTGASAEPGS